MNSIRIKPRFKLETTLQKEEFKNHLKSVLEERKQEFSCNINSEVTLIWVKTEHNNYWKPYLSLRTEIEDEKMMIRGIFGPSAAVWTFFMFLYFIFGITIMVFASIWWVTNQIKSQDFPYSIDICITSSLLLVFTFIATKIGQRLGRKEMEKLKSFAEKHLTEL